MGDRSIGCCSVRANCELHGISAGLWYRVCFKREHLHPPRRLLENLRGKNFLGWRVQGGDLGHGL